MPDDRLAHLVKDATRALGARLQNAPRRRMRSRSDIGHFCASCGNRDGLTQRELSEQAGVMEPTTFSALKAMERPRLRRPPQTDGDRKKVYVFLTPKGRRLREKSGAARRRGQSHRRARACQGPTLQPHRAVLLAIIENLARDEQAADMRMPSTRDLVRMKAGGRKRY